jgi:alkanesulfonate monooxygenase SsuD/methylene tetrahydromethanopterin reductase-like flavin-dependent oxidoreductase (luciferase family)
VTRQARVGSFVLNVMNRHPAVVARMAATLQEVSGGRFVLGIGIGGHPREHEAYGIDFPPAPERAARLEEAITVIRALWTGGPASFSGSFYRLTDAYAEPAPQPRPPILVGAQTPTGIALAARAADGWAAEAPFFADLMPRYLEALAGAGRSRGDQLVVLGFNAGRSGEEALRNSPWIDAPRETWAEWHERGADEVTVTARTTTDVDALVRAAERW